MQKYDIEIYKNKSGKNPFDRWIYKLDNKNIAKIFDRLNRVQEGNLGDAKPIKGIKSLYELRFSFGAGYRVYYTIKNNKLIILLCGGDKSSQRKDIEKAKEYLKEI